MTRGERVRRAKLAKAADAAGIRGFSKLSPELGSLRGPSYAWDPTLGLGGGGGGGGRGRGVGSEVSEGSAESKPDYCNNPVYQGLDLIDRGAGYAQWTALGGGALGQTEPYAATRLAFRAGALDLYAAFGLARDFATLGKFALGNKSSAADLTRTLAIKLSGLDKARQVLADWFNITVDRALDRKDPCQK